MGFNDKTIAILSIIASKYWISTENKENFESKLKENDKEHQEELQEKYNSDNLFKNRETKENTVAMVEYKTSIFTKIKKLFKRIF